jgi:hypothetical protein
MMAGAADKIRLGDKRRKRYRGPRGGMGHGRYLTFERGDNSFRRFEKIGVVGAGMMGSKIAFMFALAGHPTKLSDQDVSQSRSARRLRRVAG